MSTDSARFDGSCLTRGYAPRSPDGNRNFALSEQSHVCGEVEAWCGRTARFGSIPDRTSCPQGLEKRIAARRQAPDFDRTEWSCYERLLWFPGANDSLAARSIGFPYGHNREPRIDERYRGMQHHADSTELCA